MGGASSSDDSLAEESSSGCGGGTWALPLPAALTEPFLVTVMDFSPPEKREDNATSEADMIAASSFSS